MSSNNQNEPHYNVVLFYSVSGALRAEKLLKTVNVPIKIIPVPRQLSSDCGVCVRFEPKDQPKVREIITQYQLEIQGIYPI